MPRGAGEAAPDARSVCWLLLLRDKIVGFHDATRLTTLRNSAMPGPLTLYLILSIYLYLYLLLFNDHTVRSLPPHMLHFCSLKRTTRTQARGPSRTSERASHNDPHGQPWRRRRKRQRIRRSVAKERRVTVAAPGPAARLAFRLQASTCSELPAAAPVVLPPFSPAGPPRPSRWTRTGWLRRHV